MPASLMNLSTLSRETANASSIASESTGPVQLALETPPIILKLPLVAARQDTGRLQLAFVFLDAGSTRF